MQKWIKSGAVILSESIWVYFTLSLFISVEWDEPIFVSAIWWVVAGLLSYILNMLTIGRSHYLTILIGNGLLISFLIIQNWIGVVPEGEWLIGIFLSFAIGFVYMRSAVAVYNGPKRQQIIARFEMNILIYIVLAVIFSVKNWESDLFHLLFLGAIFATLLAMILALDDQEETEGNKHLEIHKVGNSHGLVGFFCLLIASVIVASSLLFLPVVREQLQDIVFLGLRGITLAFQHIESFLIWLFHLFETSDLETTPPEMEIPNSLPNNEMVEEPIIKLPLKWILGSLGLTFLVVFTLILRYFLKNWRPRQTVITREKSYVKKSNWKKLWMKMIKLLSQIKYNWRLKFMRYYIHDMYWYVNQIKKWGKKNGCKQQGFETTKEYLEKVIHLLEYTKDPELSMREKKQIILQLHTLNQDYYATYYGQKEPSNLNDYVQLIKKLNHLSIKKDKFSTSK